MGKTPKEYVVKVVDLAPKFCPFNQDNRCSMCKLGELVDEDEYRCLLLKPRKKKGVKNHE